MNRSHFFKHLDVGEQAIVLHCQCVSYAVAWRGKLKEPGLSDDTRHLCIETARQFASSAREHWDTFLRVKSIREAA